MEWYWPLEWAAPPGSDGSDRPVTIDTHRLALAQKRRRACRLRTGTFDRARQQEATQDCPKEG